MRIQRDTKTDIKIPRMGENKDIVIYGPSIAVCLSFVFVVYINFTYYIS